MRHSRQLETTVPRGTLSRGQSTTEQLQLFIWGIYPRRTRFDDRLRIEMSGGNLHARTNLY